VSAPAPVLELPDGPVPLPGPGEAQHAVWALLEGVSDPEIPVVSLREMGILRAVREGEAGLEVVITPTYSGCPAMQQMHDDVQATLARAGVVARVRTQLAPAWTTDWMTPQAREKLRAYGIAPPGACVGTAAQPIQFASKMIADRGHSAVDCPRCGSENTTEISPFGSTACKALYKCLDCLEPFDYFKPI